MSNSQKFIVFVIVSIFAATLARAEVSSNRGPKLKSFEFFGCSGDAVEKRPAILRLTHKDQVTFLVRHEASCGLDGKSPRISIANGKLDLAYTLSSPNNAVVMCDCEYWAKFTFGREAFLLNDVTFSGQKTEHLGD